MVHNVKLNNALVKLSIFLEIFLSEHQSLMPTSSFKYVVAYLIRFSYAIV